MGMGMGRRGERRLPALSPSPGGCGQPPRRGTRGAVYVRCSCSAELQRELLSIPRKTHGCPRRISRAGLCNGEPGSRERGGREILPGEGGKAGMAALKGVGKVRGAGETPLAAGMCCGCLARRFWGGLTSQHGFGIESLGDFPASPFPLDLGRKGIFVMRFSVELEENIGDGLVEEVAGS